MWRPNHCAFRITVFFQFLILLASKSLCFSSSLLCWRPNHSVFPVPSSVGVEITVLFQFLTLLASKPLHFSRS